MKPVALVTGSARGIGLGIAEGLGAAGFDLAVCATRDEADVALPLAALRSTGAEVVYCRCDVSDRDARARMLARVEDAYGRLNVLVNNAGVAPTVRTDILDATEESYERVMGINLQGPYFLTQLVARWMIAQRAAEATCVACIVNVSSISATVASPSRGEYCISKAGISMATQLWAARLGEFGIGVYEVRPGIIQTDMTAAVKEKYDRLIEQGLLVQPRWGQPSDVAKVVVALARGDLAYSTGQAITVDGGLTLARL
jgi:NAD(P)-dependent dehydrogenase (short-subunit alcohol dehydrogenase family)